VSVSYSSDWRRIDAAAAALGTSISTLYRLRRDGVLLRAVHWHRVGGGRRAPVVINVTAARLALQVWCTH
jgi:SLT domain-containing protein